MKFKKYIQLQEEAGITWVIVYHPQYKGTVADAANLLKQSNIPVFAVDSQMRPGTPKDSSLGIPWDNFQQAQTRLQQQGYQMQSTNPPQGQPQQF